MQLSLDLSPDLHAKLARLAAEQGREPETLELEAITNLVDHDEWFRREVQKGLAAADRGEFVEHDEIRKRIDSRSPG